MKKDEFEFLEDKEEKPGILSVVSTIIVIIIGIFTMIYCVSRSTKVIYDGGHFQIIEWYDGKQYIVDRSIFGGGMSPYEP